jgi:hypothetical protein
MNVDINKYTKHCDIHQRAKLDNTSLLQPLPMNFIEGLPKSNHYFVILVVIYKLSKYACFIPITYLYSAIKIAHLFS